MKYVSRALMMTLTLGLSSSAIAGPVKIVVSPTIVAPRPAPTVQVKTVRPSVGAVWVEGHWRRDHLGRRVWVAGHWKQVTTRRVVRTVRAPAVVARTVRFY